MFFLVPFLFFGMLTKAQDIREVKKISRLSVAVSNYAFSGSGDSAPDGMNRFTMTGQAVKDSEGFSGMWESFGSSGSFSGDGFDYSDSVLGLAYGFHFGTGGSFNLYLSCVTGISYYWGETTIDMLGIYETESFNGWGWYYNAGVGLDLMFSEKFGLTMQVGLSKIPMVTVGIAF